MSLEKEKMEGCYTLYTMKNLEKTSDRHIKDYLQLIKKSPVKEWIVACNDQIIQGSKLIKSLIGSQSDDLLIEFHSDDFYPSDAALLEKEAFINHIKRHIGDQLEQLQPNNANIIVIQGHNWTMSFLDKSDIEHLCKEIKESLSQKKVKSLSGIALFSRDFNKSIFISNEIAEPASKLSENEIKMLGMRFIEPTALNSGTIISF